jgi:hypothetical protein
MQRLVTGYDIRGSWIVVQDGVCRYSVTPADAGVLVRSVLWEYLATEVWWGDGDDGFVFLDRRHADE